MKSTQPMTHLERFINAMEYKPVDRLPNWEYGQWQQTIDRWESEGLNVHEMHWNLPAGSPEFRLDPREYIHINPDMMPPFERKTLELTDRYEIYQDHKGIIHKALVEGESRGCRMSMDQYLRYPVTCQEDFDELKKRYNPSATKRLELYWDEFRVEGWKRRQHPLVLGENCTLLGFYWRMREWMGTEGLSYAFYDDPDAVVFGCAGLGGILERPLDTPSLGLLLFGEVCTVGDHADFGNLMLSKLRVLPK